VDQVDSTIRALDPTTDHLTPGAEQVDPVSGEVDVASLCQDWATFSHGKIGIAERKLDTLLKILFLIYNSKQISCKETKLPSHMKREMLIK